MGAPVYATLGPHERPWSAEALGELFRRARSRYRAGMPRPNFLRQVLIVAKKDLVLESRSGEVTLTSTFFALLVVVMSSMSFHGGPRTGRIVLSGVLWVAVAFAAVLALGR